MMMMIMYILYYIFEETEKQNVERKILVALSLFDDMMMMVCIWGKSDFETCLKKVLFKKK